MRSRTIAKATATAAATVVASGLGAGAASAEPMNGSCLMGPTFEVFADDNGLVTYGRPVCGVFGNKPHTVTVELEQVNNPPHNRTGRGEGRWIPNGPAFQETSANLWGVYWGKPGVESNFRSCVTVRAPDTGSWFKRCLKAQSMRRSPTSLSFTRAIASTESHGFGGAK